MKIHPRDWIMLQRSSMSMTRSPRQHVRRLIKTLVLCLTLNGLLVACAPSASQQALLTTVVEQDTQEVPTTSQTPTETIFETEPPTTEAPTTIETDAPAIEEPETTLYKLTAYCPCEICCGKSNGITATGTKATAGRTVAVDPNKIPYGSEVIINGHTYIAEDCGGAIKGNKIDIFFDTHQEALAFGVQYAEVEVRQYASCTDESNS